LIDNSLQETSLAVLILLIPPGLAPQRPKRVCRQHLFYFPVRPASINMRKPIPLHTTKFFVLSFLEISKSYSPVDTLISIDLRLVYKHSSGPCTARRVKADCRSIEFLINSVGVFGYRFFYPQNGNRLVILCALEVEVQPGCLIGQICLGKNILNRTCAPVTL
jgi:hypothetical protein